MDELLNICWLAFIYGIVSVWLLSCVWLMSMVAYFMCAAVFEEWLAKKMWLDFCSVSIYLDDMNVCDSNEAAG